MSHGAAAPAYRPTAWAYLASGDCTIRWQRGDKVAYIFEGKQLETYPDEPLKVPVLATIPVFPQGWVDQTHVRRVGEAWVKVKRKRCQACGVVS
ncbi:MAG TPA: hypothetical protein VJT72_02595 [Pseudonocardiaceae bacterium]|nr:hypothetical protein [Pseudonocardiaceae bacterium]